MLLYHYRKVNRPRQKKETGQHDDPERILFQRAALFSAGPVPCYFQANAAVGRRRESVPDRAAGFETWTSPVMTHPELGHPDRARFVSPISSGIRWYSTMLGTPLAPSPSTSRSQASPK